MAHTPIKPEKLVATAAVSLEEQLVVPAAMRREGIDKFKGAKDDTINVTVDGVLPYRSYGWRNNRSAPVVFDEYTERKVAVSFGDDTYNGVKLTDEQNEMDFDGWTKLASKQTEAIGRGLEYKAIAAIEAAPFEVQVTLDEADMRGSLIKLKQVFDKLRVPGKRTVYINDDLELALLNDEKLQLAQNVGDAEAVTALREATLGKRFTFDFVKASELSLAGVAMSEGGFIFLNAAPSVPQSVAFGATASHNGVALRWIRDYDTEYQRDRSLFTTWHDFHYVDDPLVGRDGNDQSFISTQNHFVRAVKVDLGSAYSVEIDNEELATITGLDSTDGTNDGA